MMPRLLPLCLSVLLTACGTPRVQYVPVPPVPIPDELLADCLAPMPPEPFTYGASVDYNLQLLAVIKNCNADKAGIRQIELSRHPMSKK
ncbi:Rz1-like lysis system protein LysC [Edwardsiella anguillarum]